MTLKRLLCLAILAEVAVTAFACMVVEKASEDVFKIIPKKG